MSELASFPSSSAVSTTCSHRDDRTALTKARTLSFRNPATMTNGIGRPAVLAAISAAIELADFTPATVRKKDSATREGRVIIASARLPVSAVRRADTWDVAPSPGGLATALRSVADRQTVSWFGLPGSHIPETDRAALGRKLLASGCRPVFGTRAELEGFSESFSNGVLWPLFHGLAKRSHFDLSGWKAYEAINARFADAIAQAATPDDLVWVHDYQLALVPELLRQRGVDCPIGFSCTLRSPRRRRFGVYRFGRSCSAGFWVPISSGFTPMSTSASFSAAASGCWVWNASQAPSLRGPARLACNRGTPSRVSKVRALSLLLEAHPESDLLFCAGRRHDG